MQIFQMERQWREVTREKAIEYLEWVRPKKPYTLDRKNVQTAIDMGIEALKERPQGKWVPGREISQMWTGNNLVGIDYEDFSCSCCGVVVEESTEPEWNFCPNCGADMRKEGDEE